MRFFRDDHVRTVLVRQPGRSSCISHTFRFSARFFLALIAMEACMQVLQELKPVTKKSLFFVEPPLFIGVSFYGN